ncbi:MAG TPA: hypothetical protein PKG81_04635, partial [Candidatus Omnitrophota bacterium]|nr:hypothetical protein [Candidatus Omnitrophota bacterium]
MGTFCASRGDARTSPLHHVVLRVNKKAASRSGLLNDHTRVYSRPGEKGKRKMSVQTLRWKKDALE